MVDITEPAGSFWRKRSHRGGFFVARHSMHASAGTGRAENTSGQKHLSSGHRLFISSPPSTSWAMMSSKCSHLIKTKTGKGVYKDPWVTYVLLVSQKEALFPFWLIWTQGVGVLKKNAAWPLVGGTFYLLKHGAYWHRQCQVVQWEDPQTAVIWCRLWKKMNKLRG